MSRSLKNSPQQLRIIALADRAGMKGIRSSDAVAVEMALLPPDQQTKARKHVITANVCHALRKLSRSGLLACFCAPDGLIYLSVAVLRAAEAIEQQSAIAPEPVPSQLNPPNEQQSQPANLSSLDSVDQTIAVGVQAALEAFQRSRG